MRRAVVILVFSPDGAHVLTVARPEDPRVFALPGGHVEQGETPAQAAARELAEETGVVALSLHPLCDGVQDAAPVQAWIAPRWQGEPHAAEGLAVKWMGWEELRAQAGRFGHFLDCIGSAVLWMHKTGATKARRFL